MNVSPSAARRPGFTIDVTDRGDVVIVTGTGELDLAADPLLTTSLQQALSLGRPVVVDLTTVALCGSCVLTQLADAGRRLWGTGRTLTVATTVYAVLRPLALLHLDLLLTLVADLDTAFTRLGLPGGPVIGAADVTPEST